MVLYQLQVHAGSGCKNIYLLGYCESVIIITINHVTVCSESTMFQRKSSMFCFNGKVSKQNFNLVFWLKNSTWAPYEQAKRGFTNIFVFAKIFVRVFVTTLRCYWLCVHHISAVNNRRTLTPEKLFTYEK